MCEECEKLKKQLKNKEVYIKRLKTRVKNLKKQPDMDFWKKLEDTESSLVCWRETAVKRLKENRKLERDYETLKEMYGMAARHSGIFKAPKPRTGSGEITDLSEYREKLRLNGFSLR